MASKIIAGIMFIGIGILFFFNNKNMGKGAHEFYKWFYTKKNLIIMFRASGIVLIIGGIILIIIN